MGRKRWSRGAVREVLGVTLITTYHVGGHIPAAPQQNRASELDSVAGTFTAWNAAGAVTESRALSADEVSRFAALEAGASILGNGTTVRSRAQAALAANATFLGIASPTNAQVATQVQRLTRECSAIIRLLLNELSDVSDT